MSEEIEKACVYCGAEEDLKPDPNLEEIWVCAACQARSDDHSAVIDHGFTDEEPKIE